jgi:hypothetical protein
LEQTISSFATTNREAVGALTVAAQTGLVAELFPSHLFDDRRNQSRESSSANRRESCEINPNTPAWGPSKDL